MDPQNTSGASAAADADVLPAERGVPVPPIPQQRLADDPQVQIVARPAAPQVHSGQTIAAVERALDVLLLFGTLGRGDLGVTEIAAELGMSKAAVHRVLSSLRSRGLVSLDRESHRYSLGAEVLGLGRAYIEQLEVHRLALPEMTRLASVVGETVAISVQANDHQMFVDQALPDRQVALEVPIAVSIPLHAGSAGKVLLAQFTDEDIDDYVARTGLATLTDTTITDAEALRLELAEVRRLGYATSTGERVAGGASVASPILGLHGRPLAVLVVAGPAERMADRFREITDPLVATTTALSRRLGWVGIDIDTLTMDLP